MQHTERTQNAHTQRTEQNTEHKQNNMQHREQDTENNTEHRIQNTEYTENTDTETNNHAENSTQPQRTVIHTYSYDFYHEFVAIKNSDTIEIYTILK